MAGCCQHRKARLITTGLFYLQKSRILYLARSTQALNRQLFDLSKEHFTQRDEPTFLKEIYRESIKRHDIKFDR